MLLFDFRYINPGNHAIVGFVGRLLSNSSAIFAMSFVAMVGVDWVVARFMQRW